MFIRIERIENLYAATIAGRGGDVVWSTPEPMPCRRLIEALSDRGFHQQDIGDAFYEAD